MKAKSPQIVDLLNEVLTAELTAINQYFLHAKMMKHWGFERLASKIRKESIDEMRHADMLSDRILLLEGLPNYQRLNTLGIGETVEEQLQSDLQLEYTMVDRLNRGIALAASEGDHGTRALLERILVSEDEHIDWLESQIEAIKLVGIQNYLAEQLHE
ncbi:MAG: bacterioferritin [Deltaproteobacteria bacterium]|nr:bacterioferritin [Deltaproteobacteria bacterium]